MSDLELFPLKPSGGGVLQPEQTVGRDSVIEELWGILQVQGLVLFAERRFGKSAILRKMCAEPPEGFLPIYKGLEGLTKIDDLANELFQHVAAKKLFKPSLLKQIEDGINTMTSYVSEIGSIGVRQVKSRWQRQLIYLLEKIHEYNPGKIIVIMLDEFTILLDRLERDQAIELIGFLRELVQDRFKDRLRFVYCGSIGIDLVLDKLKSEGHNLGDPINHMEKHLLKPFENQDAEFFCRCLALGCNITLTDIVVKRICFSTDNIPFFIDRLMHALRSRPAIDVEMVDQVLQQLLQDQTNKTNLKHFYDRIDKFYPNPQASDALLTYLATKTKPVIEATIIKNVRSVYPFSERLLRDELDRLRIDGYLKREIKAGTRRFSFNYYIIQQWWLVNKA